MEALAFMVCVSTGIRAAHEWATLLVVLEFINYSLCSGLWSGGLLGGAGPRR
jgi:hypothetical protein